MGICTVGDMGIRTPGLLIANQSLYQLSYIPDVTRFYHQLKKKSISRPFL